MEEQNNERYEMFMFGLDADQNIKMTRGDTFAFALELEGLGQDLDSAFFTCRESYDGDVVFQKSLSNGISKVEDGVYRVRIAPEDTKNIECKHYYYDFEINVNSDSFTLLKGDLMIDHDSSF